MVGQDQDDTAIVLFITVQRKLARRTIPVIHQAMVTGVSEPVPSSPKSKSPICCGSATGLLRERPTISRRNMADIANLGQLTTIMTLLLGSIAAISLIVGVSVS